MPSGDPAQYLDITVCIGRRLRAMGEVGMEAGFLFFQRISMGLGVECQIVALPGETIAEGAYASVNMGLCL
jgi:hypothetical protein